MLNVLRHFEHSIDRYRRQHFRIRMSWKCESLWDELDPLTGGFPTLARRGDSDLTPRQTVRGCW
jgi:hypothetical protein